MYKVMKTHEYIIYTALLFSVIFLCRSKIKLGSFFSWLYRQTVPLFMECLFEGQRPYLFSDTPSASIVKVENQTFATFLL